MRKAWIPVALINQDTRFERFNGNMANLDVHYAGKRRSLPRTRLANGKWSNRRTVFVAVTVSGALWVMIFWIAKVMVA